MSADIATRLLAEIDGRFEAMERAPSPYGGSEAVEFQYLTLLELRGLITRPAASRQNPGEVMDAYERFVRSVNGEPTNTFLHCILRSEGRLAELPGLLHDFRMWLLDQQPPESNG